MSESMENQERRLTLGQTVYRFDENRRRYTRPVGGRLYGEIIWREHWSPEKVIGENKVSYLIGQEWSPRRLAKKEVRSGALLVGWALSDEELDHQEFLHNAHRIAETVRRIRDYKLLKEVADLIGWKLTPANPKE